MEEMKANDLKKQIAQAKMEARYGLSEETYRNILDEANSERVVPATFKPIQPPIGWVCPVCGRGLSPFTAVCPCKGPQKIEITC